MKQATYNPAPAKCAEGLPELCWALDEITSKPIILRRGVSGYYPTDYPVFTSEAVDRLNEKLGVSPAQRAAMEAGSMFGWHVPGADPARYGPDGRFVKAKA